MIELDDIIFHAPPRWEEQIQVQPISYDVCLCPVCGAAVPEYLAGTVCPAEGCYPMEAGGWL